MIRAARPDDVRTIATFIRELADYEKLTAECAVDEAKLREHLFGARPCVEALLACDGETPVGFALFLQTYSTFKTSPCLYLEDLFVQPHARGHGHGAALLRRLAAIAVARGLPRFDWSVLDWNELAIDFYRRLGAQVMPDWRICRLQGDALLRVAHGDVSPTDLRSKPR